MKTRTATALVSTNSICQGVQVPILWPIIFSTGNSIHFAHTSFKWSNLANHNAGVTVAIVGMSNGSQSAKRLYSIGDNGTTVVKEVDNINSYLASGRDIDIQPSKVSISGCAYMDLGNMPKDGGNLLFSFAESERDIAADPSIADYVFDFVGSQEFVKGIVRRCLWIEDEQADIARRSPVIAQRLEGVSKMRVAS